MKRVNNSTDGFTPRRPHRVDLKSQYEQEAKNTIGSDRLTQPETSDMHTGDSKKALKLRTEAYAPGSSRIKDSISSSLAAIDDTPEESPRQRRKKKSKKRRSIKITSLILGLILAVIAGWLIYKAWSMASRILANGNMFDLLQEQPLKVDKFGRSNLLIVGSTDDEPDRPGAGLTDSMMVLSVDQEAKDAYMFSIPRDLYVDFGKACAAGYKGKINEYFACSADGSDQLAETKRMDETRKFVGGIFDMDIQYVAHINTLVIRDAVDAVGGVTVDVQSRDPRGVLDASIDWMCTKPELTPQQRKDRCPTGHYIDFKNGPNEMDGDKAMWFSRARGAFEGVATYGLENSNFDREKNQQLVLMALKTKATSAGVLTDFAKITSLMDAMGSNLRTNVEAREVRTAMKVASEIKEADVHRLSFYEEDNRLMTNGVSPTNGSIVQPVAGLYSYSEIRQFLRNNIYATPVSRDKARVIVLNASGVSGAAREQADKLEELGMVVADIGNAPEQDKAATTVYSIAGDDKLTATRSKLAELYKTAVKPGSPPFSLTTAEVDFVVVVGQ